VRAQTRGCLSNSTYVTNLLVGTVARMERSP
jgi:hypothetical protein